MDEGIRWASVDDGEVAFRTLGDGPPLLLIDDWITNLEAMWECSLIERFHRRLARSFQLVLFDKRGTGISDPTSTSRLDALPTIEEAVRDALAVLDAAGIDQAAVLGVATGGWVAMQLAAIHPERVRALVLTDPVPRFARSDDFSMGVAASDVRAFAARVGEAFGTGATLKALAPDLAGDAETTRWFARYERMSCTRRLMASHFVTAAEIDQRSLLPFIQAPTLVVEHEDRRRSERGMGRATADLIPAARFREAAGANTYLWAPQPAHLMDDIEAFLGAQPATSAETERVLAAVLMTDVVESTTSAVRMGDRRWREVLESHDLLSGRCVEHHGGTLVKQTGDGVLATFDGPGRAVRSALALHDQLSHAGIPIRAGVHVGEIERRGDDIGGVAVHLTARIQSAASAGETLVSRTVKDLVAGADLEFTDRGSFSPKGFDEPWQLYLVRPRR